MTTQLQVVTMFGVVGAEFVDIYLAVKTHLVLHSALQHLGEHLRIETSRLVTLRSGEIEHIVAPLVDIHRHRERWQELQKTS